MAYFDFNYVTDPPNDENVNSETQLNENWEELDTKLTPFQKMPTTLVNPPQGTESYSPNSSERIAVWTGATWLPPLSHTPSPVQNWTKIALRSPAVTATASSAPAYLVNPVLRKVHVTGGVMLGTGTAWSTTGSVEITTDTAIPVELTPQPGGFSIHQCGTSRVTTANGFASAVVWCQVEPEGNLSIRVRWQGDAVGNQVFLDGLSWWY